MFIFAPDSVGGIERVVAEVGRPPDAERRGELPLGQEGGMLELRFCLAQAIPLSELITDKYLVYPNGETDLGMQHRAVVR